MVMPRKYFAEAGQRFGRLTVTDPDARMAKPGGGLLYAAECRCDCGGLVTVLQSSLFTGNSRSCGCYQREMAAASGRASSITHGLTQHPLYRTWSSMMHRCYDEKRRGYRRYGGRGITVCDEWHDPAAFISWIEENLGSRPPGMTLDRIDNARGVYEPGAVRWATDLQQARNTSRTRLTEQAVREIRAVYGTPGITRSVLAARFGVSTSTISDVAKGRSWRLA